MIYEEIKKLNAEQRNAVEKTSGNVLVLAGAGSGKTKVLTVRIAHLIHNCNVNPKSILGLTFTNKAASEMKERLSHLISSKSAKEVTLCTFHSFCCQVLRRDIECLGYTRQFSLYDEYDVNRMFKQIACELLEHNSTLPSLEKTAHQIHLARNLGLGPDDLPSENMNWHDQFVQELYKKFKICMRAYNAVDFDDILFLTLKLFKEHPMILQYYQERFSHVLIDEYQDTNKIQYELVSLLAQKHQNLCIVGDDDQSIYGWRGADVKNILSFKNAFQIKLEQNYRSTDIILKAANSVISHNKNRYTKELWSKKQSGHLIEVFHAPTEMQEAEAVVTRIANLRKEKQIPWSEIAILYRSNALSRPFEQALLKHVWQDGNRWIRGVPYQIFGGEEYFERKEVKDLIGYLRVILNPSDQEALLRIINVPRRGIGAETLEKITSHNRQHQISLWDALLNFHTILKTIPEKTASSLNNFIHIITHYKTRFEQEMPSQVLSDLIEEIEFKRAIAEDVKSEKMRSFKWDNIQALIQNLVDYEREMQENDSSTEISLHDFLTRVPLARDKPFQKQKSTKEDCIHLMTFHSAKGLEFEACFLVALEDNIIPHEKSMKETGVEEERRLMYVAITRAKTYLTLSMARMRHCMGKEMPTIPSRFLNEISKDLLKPTFWKL